MYDTVNEDQLDDLSEKAEIWDCTTCWTCAARCPKGLEPLEVLIGLRTVKIGEGKIQPTVRDALESMGTKGNPWGMPRPSVSTGPRGWTSRSWSRERRRPPTCWSSSAAPTPTTRGSSR